MLDGDTERDELAPEQQAGRSNLMQLVLLRWAAVAGQVLTMVVVHYGLGIRLPLLAMLSLVVALSLFNLASWARARSAHDVSHHELFAGLLVDLCILTGLLALSGGVNNPFVFLYLPQVAVGALLLQRGHVWVLVALGFAAIIFLSQWHVPLAWPDAPEQRLSIHYVGGLLLCYAVCAALVVVGIERISQNLQRRDARLTALRQRAAEEGHIVRMGLLASGAAHELGTPLATLSVILGDWARMAPFAAEPELREEIEQMQAQVERCKTIIGGILRSAGDTRGDDPETTPLADFLNEVADDWADRRMQADFQAELGALPEAAIIADTGLRQMITNVLDNALEAAPTLCPRLLASCDGHTLVLRVLDYGPGFTPEMLSRFGLPYSSTKQRPGSGLGLFLSVNVARKLGGNVRALNREGGGAEVRIELPLARLAAGGARGGA